jgi:hypothetical protein
MIALRFSLLWLATSIPVIATMFVGADATLGEDRVSFADIWMQIQEEQHASNNDLFADEDSKWASFATRLQATFYSAVKAEDSEDFLKYYVAQFGRHGADADLRWVLAASPASLVDRNTAPFGLDLKVAKYRFAELEISKELVARLMAEPNIRSRYWTLILYSKSLLGDVANSADYGSRFGDAISITEKGFRGENMDEYWFHARRFIMLAHATSWDESLITYRHNDLRDAFRAWKKWFNNNEEYFVANQTAHVWQVDDNMRLQNTKVNKNGHLPQLELITKPFEDWVKNTKPPAPRLIRYNLEH